MKDNRERRQPSRYLGLGAQALHLGVELAFHIAKLLGGKLVCMTAGRLCLRPLLLLRLLCLLCLFQGFL